MIVEKRKSIRRMTGFREFAAIVALMGLAQSALALPIGRDDYFTYSSVNMSGLASPQIAFHSGSDRSSVSTVDSITTSFNDPYAKPGTPAFNDVNAILPLTGQIQRGLFETAYGQSGLGAGAARAFGRQSFGNGQAHMTIVSALGDIVTVAPGGTLDARLAFGASYRFLFEAVTRDILVCPVNNLCRFEFDHSGYNVLGEGVTVHALFGIWDYNSVSVSPFGQFGNPATTSLDCTGGVQCLNQQIHFGFEDYAGLLPTFNDVFLAGNSAFSAVGGIGFSSQGVSLSRGSGGKYYVGVQLIVDIQSELLNNPDYNLAGCIVDGNDRGCVSVHTNPAVAFDMTRSLDVIFAGDAAYTSQSGVFLSGNERVVPEPGMLPLLGIALAGLGYSRRKRQ